MPDRSLSGDHGPAGSPPALPPQVSPPEFAVTATRPHALAGVDVIALPVLPDEDGELRCSVPAPTRSARCSVSTCWRVLDAENATGAAGEVTALPVPSGASDNAELRQVLLVGPRRRPAPMTSAAPAPRWPGPSTTAPCVATTIPAVEPSVGLEPFVVGTILGSFAFAWRSATPEHVPVARIVLAGLSDARPARPRPGRRHRRGELALPHAGLGALQPQEPALAGRPGGRAGRARPGSRSRSGTSSGSPTRGSAASSASGRPRPPHRGWSASTTRRPGCRGARPRWCWSARASPSTPAACRSSPARRWST